MKNRVVKSWSLTYCRKLICHERRYRCIDSRWTTDSKNTPRYYYNVIFSLTTFVFAVLGMRPLVDDSEDRTPKKNRPVTVPPTSLGRSMNLLDASLLPIFIFIFVFVIRRDTTQFLPSMSALT